MTRAAILSCPAVYFDGVTSALHEVTVALSPEGLAIRDPDGGIIDQWPYSRLKHVNAPAYMFRLGLRDSERLVRLEIVNQNVAHEIDLVSPDIDRSDARGRAERRGVIGWSFAAAIALLLVAFYGIPAIGDRLLSLVPPIVEQRLSDAADDRIRAAFEKDPEGRPFECGGAAGEAAGKAAFEKLMTKLQSGAQFNMPLRAIVLRREEANAVSLPGHIYVFGGLIEQAHNVDEVAGVIAHELGHLANRDAVRALLKAAGLSLVLGSHLGNFVGGSVAVFATEALLKLAYSRQRETDADDFAVRTMQTLNADPRAFANFMGRAAKSRHRGSIFFGHPATPDRVARINAIAPPQSGGARLLDEAEWKALKRVCAGYR